MKKKSAIRNPQSAISLAVASAESVRLAQPRGLSGAGLVVDATAGTIRNVSILTRGPTIGHGFEVDDVMLRQVADLIAAKPNGVVCHLAHSQGGLFSPGEDGIATLLGRVKNARVEVDRVRGDVHFGEYAAISPKGNLRKYLLTLAAEDPEALGLSLVFKPAEFHERFQSNNQSRLPAGRVADVRAVDFVGDPGANPGGLLSTGGSSEGDAKMNAKLRAFLETIGLKQGASEAEAIRYWHSLAGINRQRANALQEGNGVVSPTDGTIVPDVTIVPDLTPTADEAEEAFVQRFVDDPAMQQKYPDGAARVEKAKEIFAAAKAPAEEPPAPPPEPAPAPEPAMSAQTVTQALAADRSRRSAIMSMATARGLEVAWAQGLCDRGVSLAHATELATLAQTMQPVSMSRVAVGADRNLSTLSDGIRDAIRLRAGATVETPHDRSPEFRGLSIVDMYRHFLSNHGMATAFNLSRTRVVELLSPRRLRREYPTIALAMSTSDFDNILRDAINKTLQQAYLDAPTTWNIWARRATNSDFKTIYRTKLSESPDLVERKEGGEVKYVNLTDAQETYALVEYTGGLILTRKAIINDDLDAFNRIPVLHANAAARKEDDVAYAIITANAAMADGVVLFHADHANLIAAGGAAPSVTTLAATEKLLMKQKGPKGVARLNLRARYVLVPTSIYRVTQQLISSVQDPAKNNEAMNPFAQEGLVVVPSARLDDDSALVWYLVADYNRIDTIEVCFLDDEPAPVLQQETDFDTDDEKFKVRHVVAAKAIDHRGMAKNPGV